MELVAGSYEQILFGFTVHREPATSGDREVRHREPGAAGDGPRGRAGPSRRLLFLAGSAWIFDGRFLWKTDGFMPVFPAL